MVNNKLLIFILGLFLITLISAEGCSDYTWGCVKQGDTINLVMVCPLTGCNLTNITKITYPNSTISLSNTLATHEGNTWSYQFVNTEDIGVYSVYGYSTNGTSASDTYFIGDFFSTPSGRSGLDNIWLNIFFITAIYLITFVGFFGRNEIITIFGGMFMMFLGIYLINNGIIIYRDDLTLYFSYMTISLGFLFSTWSGLSLMDVI